MSLLDLAKNAFEEVAQEGQRFAQSNEERTRMRLEQAEEKVHDKVLHRFGSFAPPRQNNQVKWYVDGCGYFWALSIALEEARESIWILDWWLSPELYLRRPPSANEQYRLDRMLKAAAERGVKINVIVYKEVEKALTLCSIHTKHALEKLHPNIRVFRHPDHIVTGQAVASEIFTGLKNFSLKAHELSQLPKDGLKAIYGMADDVVLYWAHHEKLCIVDGSRSFMGGLDACFGRWDTNSHPIADAHPSNLEDIIFPGQDYNDARVYDFQDVVNWQNNKLSRVDYPRMGWSDLSICIEGPVVEDLREHFVQRWNYIFYDKYNVKDKNYSTLSMEMPSHQPENEHSSKLLGRLRQGLRRMNLDDKSRETGEEQDTSRGVVPIQLARSACQWSHGIKTEHSIANAYIRLIHESQYFIYIENQFFITSTGHKQAPVGNKIGEAIVERILRAARNGEPYKVIVCMPSVPAFAGDLETEGALGTRAIMEFQYFSICRGGNSIMEMIEREGIDPKKYIRFYNLRNFDRINTSATMAKAEAQSGVDYETARREHDDIVGAGYGGQGEGTGADTYGYSKNDQGYRTYRAGGDEISRYQGDGQGQQLGAPARERVGYSRQQAQRPDEEYRRYQNAASNNKKETFDSVSSSYMLNGPRLIDIPWTDGNEPEIDAFVSEELYIHSKVLIADDRKVICGSANLNDRSQLGTHDSEIAVIIEDETPVDSYMAGQPFQASVFATSLRRQLFRKHLGLLPHQDPTQPNANFEPVDRGPNAYDWGSREDLLVRDPLSADFAALWDGTAASNTALFSRAFHPVPADNVRTWKQYRSFFADLFIDATEGEKRKDGRPAEDRPRPKYKYGHVVRDEFPGGVQELKEWLGRVRGTLVEMPLDFLADVEDLARSGLALNRLTEELYT